jgi:D-alanyl-D-alanine carboxypeptidase
MCDDTRNTAANGFTSRMMKRRTVLAGATGALLGTAFTGPVAAGAYQATPATPAAAPFDPMLARQLQQVLDDAIAAAGGAVPGMVLHVEHAGYGSWSGATGLAQVDPDVPMRPEDRVGVGSIVKPFVATTELQLVEEGAFMLDAALTTVLPADVTDRFPQASGTTVRMMLGHRSGVPDWDSPAIEEEVAADPGRVWTASEFLDLAAAKEPVFPPGTDYAYSNTNYTLLGLVIEEATGRSWRDEMTDRVIVPLELASSALPAPGDRSLGGPHAHGYAEVDGTLLDVTTTDPSMAGAAGGNALVTSVHDLVRFLDALLAGRLFQRSETLEAMLDFQPAEGEPGQVGYGLGLLQRVLPGGIETIDHLGGAVGYTAYVARLMRQEMTVALAINATSADPSPFILPVLETLASPSG